MEGHRDRPIVRAWRQELLRAKSGGPSIGKGRNHPHVDEAPADRPQEARRRMAQDEGYGGGVAGGDAQAAAERRVARQRSRVTTGAATPSKRS